MISLHSIVKCADMTAHQLRFKSAKKFSITGGADYNLKLFQRPARFTTEAYYKHIADVVPYDIDNVRIRYYRRKQCEKLMQRELKEDCLRKW